MKTLLCLVAAALTASTATRGPCDMKQIEKGLWCAMCEAPLAAADVKGGKCAKCGEKPETAEFCVKKQAKKEISRSRVTLKCDGCGVELKPGTLCNRSECRMEKKKAVKSCALSGTAPHSTP